jgi:hypothetical protein
MWYILEIIIIVLAGLASVAFLVRYFFISSRIKKQCGCSRNCINGCSGVCSADKNEIFSKILKDNKKLNRKV